MATTRRSWASIAAQQVLRRRLAGRAGDADDRGAERAAPGGARAPAARRAGPSAARTAPGAGAHRRARARRARPRRRRRARRPAKRPPSTRVPGSPTNRSPGRASRESIVTRERPGRGRRRRPRRRARARGGGDLLRRPVAHAAPPARPSRRRTATLRPPANSWPCSWPLPAMTTTSPAPRQARSRARSPSRRSTIASVAVAVGDPGEDLGDDRLGVLRARVVGGHDREVGEPRRRSRPSAGACRGRGRRRRRRRTTQPPARQRARGAQDVLQRVGRVGVVDEHGEVLALVDRLEAPGHAAGLRQRRGDRRRRRRRARARRRSRRAR